MTYAASSRASVLYTGASLIENLSTVSAYPHSATSFHLAELWRGHIHGGESRAHQPHVHHTENVPLKAYVLGCLLLVPKELALPPAVPVKRCRHRPSICS